MGTKTCDICHGMCYLSSGRYENCYSCGGRGYGSTTDTSCTACNGTGQSTTEIQDPCWNCHGSGTVTTKDPENTTVTPPTPSGDKPEVSSTQNAPSKKSKDTVSETISGISLLAAGIVGFIIYQEKSEIGAAVIAAFVTFIVSGLALYVLYIVLKIAIEILTFVIVIAFWAAVVIFIANLMKVEWAVNLVNQL